MVAHSASYADPSFAALVGGLIHDTQDLLLQEFTLAKLEIQGELQKTKTAAVSCVLGAVKMRRPHGAASAPLAAMTNGRGGVRALRAPANTEVSRGP